MGNRQHISDELLAAYLEGNVNEKEMAQVLQAVGEDSELQEALDIALQLDEEELSLQMAAEGARNLCDVESHETAHEFVIVFRRKSNQVTNEVTNGVTHQVTHQVEHQVEHQAMHQEIVVKPRLTKEQQDIVNFCSVPRTAQDIMDRIGVYNQSRSRKKYIQPLVDMGVLEMTNPENPNASNQKYRKVRKK